MTKPSGLEASSTALFVLLIAGGLLIYAAAAIATVIVVPPVNGSWENTIKALGVASALATGIFAPMCSFAVARYQHRITKELERVRFDYTRETERLKAKLSTGLEVNKALIDAKRRAFDQMLTAAHFFYYAIRRRVFVDASEDIALYKEADRRAAEASSVVWALSKEDRLTWFQVYQQSVNLLEATQDRSKDDRRVVFEQWAPALGKTIEALELAGRAAFDEADRYLRP